MTITQQEIRERAIQFSRDWKDVTNERAEAQTFWNEFFFVFGHTRRKIARFEERVRLLGKKQGSIDLFWEGTLIAEHKSKGKDLTRAYAQALDYFPGIKDEELPRYVIVSDFANFRLHDLETGQEYDFNLEEFPDKTHLFGFISGYTKRTYHDEDPVNIKVALKMGELHDALLKSGYRGHKLELLLVRLVYCLFADDTTIFPKDQFHYIIESRTRENGSDVGQQIISIFEILNTSSDERQVNLDEELQSFPHVNGQLFSEYIPHPVFNAAMRKTLLECCSFDWGKVSPAIFGSLFQSVMDITKRRALGAHYTSERNILKAVRGLFLDELREEFERIKFDLGKLRAFHKKLATLRFFDPACGCGNFLVITYREIRKLEIDVIRQIRDLSEQRQLHLDATELSLIDVDVMFGIETEEFPVRISQVALWLTDHQMNMLLSAEFGQTYARLPLKKAPNVKQGNALKEKWEVFLSGALTNGLTLYILGNPPFVGKQHQSAEQKEDMADICGAINGFGILDYVSAWYVKATQFIKDKDIKVAFVSTNSITQGEQVGILWSHMLSEGIRIHFAHRTFIWTNEAKGQAAVFVVIVGFGINDAKTKRLYDYTNSQDTPEEKIASNINPYLVDAPNLLVLNRSTPICAVPEMRFGNMPNDDGNFLMSAEEYKQFLKEEPKAAKFIRPILSAHEYINGKERYCLWLKGASPAEWRGLPKVVERVEAVRRFREKSDRAATRKLALTPYLFGELRQPESDFVLIPLHSSENRAYIPMGFFNKNHILNNSCAAVPNASLYHFGVLTSAMHMTWMRQVCGRIKSDYRYSINLVYNNFPWPDQLKAEQMARVEKAAQTVLDARNLFPDSSLADLYDPLSMPKELLDAHRELDTAVDRCYRSQPFTTELNRLEFLFSLYKKYTEPLLPVEKKTARKRGG